MLKYTVISLGGLLVVLFCGTAGAVSDGNYWPGDSLEGWEGGDSGVWVSGDGAMGMEPPEPGMAIVASLGQGEQGTGVLRSPVFTIESPLQVFWIAGADGTEAGTNDGDEVHVRLRSHPDGEILRSQRPPGTHALARAQWSTADLMGRAVYLELSDHNPRHRDDGFAWLGFAGYHQGEWTMENPVERDDLYAVEIDGNAEMTACRTVPFLAAAPENLGDTRRAATAEEERIPVGAQAEVLYVLGMINQGWDWGVSHWGEHQELVKERQDQTWAGKQLGELRIAYEDGTADSIPLILGATLWYHNGWVHGPTHGVAKGCQEPIASRPDYRAIFEESLKLRSNGENTAAHTYYYLSIRPRAKAIRELVVVNDTTTRGRPLVSAVTLAGAKEAEGLRPIPAWTADAMDLEPVLDVTDLPDLAAAGRAVGELLYTSEADLPETVELVEFPEDLDAARIRFHGGRWADMLTNIWTANLTLIDEKFPAGTGVFHESVKDVGPWYGGYSGFGTWTPAGVYYGDNVAFARCSDHFATLALRHLNNPERIEKFTDYVDSWLYFFRHDHNPGNGPPNELLDLDRYPDDAYPNWSFVISSPASPPYPVDPIPGVQETCGHGATMVGRWVAWRRMGAPTGDWLMAPRDDVYGRSRWEVTHDAAEFICWYLDYTGMDVLFTEGETSGWAGGPPGAPTRLIADNMHELTDPAEIRKAFANASMYEVYPTWVGLVALRCSAQMAEAAGKNEEAERWRAYAARLEGGMYRLLKVGDHTHFTWRVSPYSVYPSLQDSLVHAWFSIYFDGFDPQRWDARFTQITRNSLHKQLAYPSGHAPVLASGYGQGWITKAALLLDELDDAGKLLENTARYMYDKNMAYASEDGSVDWRRWEWIIPEGTNILPDGRWHRIGDLSNGANQGPPLHALMVCAGIDNTQPSELRVLPRTPAPLEGVSVSNYFVLLPNDGGGFDTARLVMNYRRDGELTLECDAPIPALAVRTGPFESAAGAEAAAESMELPEGSSTRTEVSGVHDGGPAWWVWVEGLTGVSRLALRW